MSMYGVGRSSSASSCLTEALEPPAITSCPCRCTRFSVSHCGTLWTLLTRGIPASGHGLELSIFRPNGSEVGVCKFLIAHSLMELPTAIGCVVPLLADLVHKSLVSFPDCIPPQKVLRPIPIYSHYTHYPRHQFTKPLYNTLASQNIAVGWSPSLPLHS